MQQCCFIKKNKHIIYELCSINKVLSISVFKRLDTPLSCVMLMLTKYNIINLFLMTSLHHYFEINNIGERADNPQNAICIYNFDKNQHADNLLMFLLQLYHLNVSTLF